MLIGIGIGGDLALRTAVTELTIRGTVAIYPVLNPDATGLDLLQQATFWEALRWGRLRCRLAKALQATKYLPRLGNQPALLVQHANPSPSSEITAGDADVVVVDTNDEAIQQVVRWTTKVVTPHEHVA